MRGLFIIISILCLSACKKDRLKDDKEILVGKWKWVYTVKAESTNCDNPIQYTKLTPSSEGKNFSMEFLKKGCVVFYEDGAKTDKYRIVFDAPFQLSTLSYLSGYYEFQILLNNKEDMIFAGYVSQDTLIEKRWFPFKSTNSTVPSCISYSNYFVRE